jgi:hypothetical protein
VPVIAVRQSAADLSAVARSAKEDPHRPALVLSAVALGFALHINNGFHTPTAIRLVVAGLVLAWAALLIPRLLRRLVPDRDNIVVGLIALGLGVQLVTLMRAPFAMYVERPLPKDHPWFIALLMAAAVAAVVAAVGRTPWRWLACVTLVAANVALGVITFKASPDPAIDVVTVHRAAFTALEQGQSPYSVTFPDIYKGKESFYPPGAVQGGVVQFGYTYPIGALLMTWPGQILLGDFRYAELFALALGAVAIACAGGMTSVAVLAMGLLLFTPRVFFELEQAWTEPLLVFWLGIALWAWRERWLRLTMTAIALLVSVKQYLIVAVPLAWLMRAVMPATPMEFPILIPTTSRLPLIARPPWTAGLRAPLIVSLIVAATFVPVLVWDFEGFVRSALLVQVNENLRSDALSLAVNYSRWAGREMSTLAYGAIVLAAIVLAAWRAPATPAGYAAALAVVLFTTFAFGKKAFCNYYFFVLATLCATIACSGSQEHEGHEGHEGRERKEK